MKKIAFICGIGVFLLIVSGFIFCQPQDIKNLSEEQVPFDTVSMPLSYVMGTIDPTSNDVWVHIEDSNLNRLSFVFRYNPSSRRYLATGYMDPNAYITPGSMPISDPERAQIIALYLLRNYRSSDDDTTLAYETLLAKNQSIFTRLRLRGFCAFKD